MSPLKQTLNIGANIRSRLVRTKNYVLQRFPLSVKRGLRGPDPKGPEEKRSAVINARVKPETRRILERLAGKRSVADLLEELAQTLRETLSGDA